MFSVFWSRHAEYLLKRDGVDIIGPVGFLYDLCIAFVVVFDVFYVDVTVVVVFNVFALARAFVLINDARSRDRRSGNCSTWPFI